MNVGLDKVIDGFVKKSIFFVSKYPGIIVIFLSVLAGWFMADHFTARSLWLDEASVAKLLPIPIHELYKHSIVDNEPLTYMYAIKLWSLVFGDNEASIRGFSVFYGVGIVILLYFTGAKLFNRKKIGLIATTLACVNYFLIWFGTQARPYTFAAFLGLLSVYFFVKVLKEKSNITIISYCVVTVLMLYTHPWQLFVFAGQILSLFLFWVHDKDRKYITILVAQCIVFLFSLPYLWILLTMAKLNTNAWIEPVTLLTPFQSLTYLSFGSFWIYIVVTILSLAVWLKQRRQSEAFEVSEKQALLILGFSFGLPLTFAWLISFVKPIYVTGRYEMIVFPAFILLLSWLWSKIRNYYILFGIFILLMITTYQNVVRDRTEVASYRVNDKSLLLLLSKKMKNQDVIVTTDLSWATMSYYWPRISNNKNVTMVSFPEEIKEHPGWKDLNSMLSNKEIYEKEADILIARLKQVKQNNDVSIWVLYKGNNPLNDMLVEKLKQQFSFVSAEPLPQPHQPMWLDAILVFH